MPIFSQQKSMALFLSVCILLILVVLRISLFPFQSGDMNNFLLGWWDYIAKHGGWQSLADNFSNYNPPYLYLLVLGQKLGDWFGPANAIKMISVLFDLLTAILIYKMFCKSKTSTVQALLTVCGYLSIPTLMFNSALWGQCDVIYSFFLILCVYFLGQNKSSYAMAAFGLSIAFKMQAVILGPVLLFAVITKRIRYVDLLWCPIAFLLMLMPAVIAGRPVSDLITVYTGQFSTYHSLTMNAPNFYAWISNDQYDLFVRFGLMVGLIGGLLVVLTGLSKNIKSSEGLFKLAAFSLCLMPTLLPKMHDRYFYPAEVFLFISALYDRRFWFPMLLVTFASMCVYCQYLFGSSPIPLQLSALLPMSSCVLIYRYIRSTQNAQIA